jgi:Ca-activated chloride channel family protein
MVLDVSGSMAEKDFTLDGQKISRLDAARQAFRLFILGDGAELQGRGDDLVGLITFAARQENACPPTLTHGAVLKMLDDAQPIGVPPDSATNIGDAMALAVQLLEHARPEQKIMIVLSDGEHNVPPDVIPNALKPRQAARLAQAFGIRVYAIYAGPETSSSASEGEQALRDAAEMTGGQAFRAADTAALLDVCRQIDRLEKTRIESFQYFRYYEAYPWVGLTCVVFLMNLLLLEGTRWRRLP